VKRSDKCRSREEANVDEWEEAAHKRLEQAETLPAERWSEVWGVDD
jgi:hypothetical protein